MGTVLMEIQVRMCTTAVIFQRFFGHASGVIQNAVPSGVQRSYSVGIHIATSLHDDWIRNNDESEFPGPELWELRYGLKDQTGWLTGAKLESISNDVMTELEFVPWILTLAIDPDEASRVDLAKRYPSFQLSSLMSAV